MGWSLQGHVGARRCTGQGGRGWAEDCPRWLLWSAFRFQMPGFVGPVADQSDGERKHGEQIPNTLTLVDRLTPPRRPLARP